MLSTCSRLSNPKPTNEKMSGKKEEAARTAADRIKARALEDAKGLSRPQAERAAAAAARNDLNPRPSSSASAPPLCQKCFQSGHWTFECKNERVYLSRPTRSQQLKNPLLRPKSSALDELEGLGNRRSNVDLPRREKVHAGSHSKSEVDEHKGKRDIYKREKRKRGKHDVSESEGSERYLESDSEEEQSRKSGRKHHGNEKSKRSRKYYSSDSDGDGSERK
eukprot:Gb_09150 [translate_table: standard]